MKKIAVLLFAVVALLVSIAPQAMADVPGDSTLTTTKYSEIYPISSFVLTRSDTLKADLNPIYKFYVPYKIEILHVSVTATLDTATAKWYRFDLQNGTTSVFQTPFKVYQTGVACQGSILSAQRNVSAGSYLKATLDLNGSGAQVTDWTMVITYRRTN